MSASDTLRKVRQVRRQRSAGNTDGTAFYTGYLAIMLTLIMVVPILRLIVIELALPGTLAILQASEATTTLSLAIGLLLSAAVLIGRVRGPALLSPFLTAAVAGNDLPRRRTLWRPFRSSASILTALLTSAAAILAAVLATAGNASVTSAMVFVAASLLIGVLAGVARLTGQRLSSHRANFLATVLAVLAITFSMIPDGMLVTPWGWAAILYPSSATAAWPALVALVATVAIALAAVPRLLDSLNGPDLLVQARRWQTVGVFCETGDFTGALTELRALPKIGRAWGAVRQAPIAVLFFVRDLIDSLRTPARFISAAAALIGAGFLLAISFMMPNEMAWVPTIAGAILGYLALGVWSDGFRHAVEVTAGTSIYGFGGSKYFLLHAALPAVCVLVFAGIGAAAAAEVGTASFGGVAAIGFLWFTMTTRLFNAAKGQMPLALLLPAPTPFGDLSAALIAYWQADALIINCATVTAIRLAMESTPLWLAAVLPAATLAIHATRRKLARI